MLDSSDDTGRPARDYLVEAGGDPGRLAEAAWEPGRIRAFLEPHIEQGPYSSAWACRSGSSRGSWAGPSWRLRSWASSSTLAPPPCPTAATRWPLTWVLAASGTPPRHLFVSGQRAPHLESPRRDTHLLPDPELLAVIAELEGTSPEVLAHPELVRLLLLPVMRADLEVCETYRHARERALPVPITALGGQRDPSVSTGEMQAWQGLTSASFDAEFFPGGHFYLHTRRDEVVAALLARLSGAPTGPGDGSRSAPDLQLPASSLTAVEDS